MRPIDLLNELKGKKIKVYLYDGTEFEGVLKAFDLNTNLSLDVRGDIKFIQGFRISYFG